MYEIILQITMEDKLSAMLFIFFDNINGDKSRIYDYDRLDLSLDNIINFNDSILSQLKKMS